MGETFIYSWNEEFTFSEIFVNKHGFEFEG